MTEKITLKGLFESHKNELEQKLRQMSLPKDTQVVQQLITDYLNKLFDSNGEFRQSLTQAEDYMLQAAMSLLSAQQEMCNAILPQIDSIANRVDKGDFSSEKSTKGMSNSHSYTDSYTETENLKVENGCKKELKKDDIFHIKMSSTQSMIGSAGGALVGKVLLGGWGAVFGAIAGTAIAVYLASRTDRLNVANKSAEVNVADKDCKRSSISTTTTTSERLIDVEKFSKVLSSVCESVDNMIVTFRSQINRVVSKYENTAKPSFEDDYRPILENIQSLVGYSRMHSGDEKFVRKIQERVEDLAEMLDICSLSFVDYTEDKESWFEKVSSPNTTQPKMVYPAITKGGQVVIMGKIFIPEN